MTDKGPNTLYHHPISGNALGPLLYVSEKKLGIQCEFMDSRSFQHLPGTL